MFFLSCYRHHRDLHSFPTRRSSDLVKNLDDQDIELYRGWHVFGPGERVNLVWRHEASLILRESSAEGEQKDRKSTRLNSSHTVISYAVFCLKKKKNKHTPRDHINLQ